MELTQIFNMLNTHPICQLATSCNNIPRVRHIMIYHADETGILFHTSSDKDVYQELLDNNNVELCFLNIQTFIQIRISGKAILINNDTLKNEIIEHPSRFFLKRLKNLYNKHDFDNKFAIFKVVKCTGHIWSVEMNYDKMQQTEKNYFYF